MTKICIVQFGAYVLTEIYHCFAKDQYLVTKLSNLSKVLKETFLVICLFCVLQNNTPKLLIGPIVGQESCHILVFGHVLRQYRKIPKIDAGLIFGGITFGGGGGGGGRILCH